MRIKSKIYESSRNLYRGRRGVSLQTFNNRHRNRKLSIIVALSTKLSQKLPCPTRMQNHWNWLIVEVQKCTKTNLMWGSVPDPTGELTALPQTARWRGGSSLPLSLRTPFLALGPRISSFGPSLSCHLNANTVHLRLVGKRVVDFL